jgi:phosphopantetheinyl transferase
MSESWQELNAMIKLPKHELQALDEKKTDKRKQEWLACRVLLNKMAQIEPVIFYDQNRKPHIKDSTHQISMSHSGDYASVYLHSRAPVGVDLQLMKPSISKGSDYFLNESEQKWAALENNLLLHLIWSAKEAAFKYAGNADLDLKKHIITNQFDSNQNDQIEVCIQRENSFESIGVHYDTFENYVLAWTV